jgi:TfoX/Sxy family transcriptional regulator of competence genes
VAFDADLAARVREEMHAYPGVSERKMFGGIGFMVHGNMAVGVHGRELIVRIDAGEHDDALGQTATRTFDVTGREMRGWLLVGPAGVKTPKQLRTWVEKGAAFASTLPPKKR